MKRRKPKRKMDVPRPYNGGEWTEARFRSFIMSALRSASKRWGPRQEALKGARTRRGFYLCALCREEVPASSWSVYKSGKKKGKPKKVKNNQMDHVEPVIPFEWGDGPKFIGYDWNEVARRLFTEVDGWQCICNSCHERVTAEERERRKK